MSKELVIGSNPHETKVAILEEDQLVEVYFQRENEYSLAGSIHKGRVTRVLPGMQSAFVDLGLERDTFLYVSDFFEENEDIDTVAEEKPSRGDRRERNGNPARGSERRPFERPAQETSGAEPVSSEPIQLAAVESVGPSPEPAELETAAAPAQERTEGPPSEQRGEDRGFRADRRGRRSRRRRQRGGGFPENKYAQASGATPQLASEAPPARSSFETREPAEVILLPGESLAKYRHVSTATEAAEPRWDDREERREPDTGYGDAGAESATEAADSAEQEDLAQEAEEIALADKIFSHNDEESPSDVEDKLAEVEQDIPEEDLPDHGTASLRADPQVERFAPAVKSNFQSYEYTELDPVIAPEEREPTDARLDYQEPIVLDEFEILTVHEGLTGVDEPLLDRGLQFEENSATGQDDEFAAGPGETAPETASSQAQPAEVREQGGRYTNRSSRRMRRRRGGNRFAQPGQEVSPESRRAETPIASPAGATAGAAVAPEVRTEMHRERLEDRAVEKPERVYPSISDLLKPGQEIIVQIAKEPLGQKGARITSHIALPGRYVVFMPSVNHLGVSRKVASDEERQRLKRILQAHRPGAVGGFIVRTAGEGVPEDEIASDMQSLYSLWLDIRQKAEKKPAPVLLHYDLDVVQRILRDQVTEEFKAIWVDNEDLYENVVTFMQRFQPALVNRVKMYTRSTPIFDAFNITQELEKALRPKVWLKSGGYIVINQTEALVAIDINTGKYVGKSNRLEDTIVKTNTEAVKEIVRQIRLRDLGGIIVVDFIDMDERKNRQKVMQALEEAMQADKAPYKILQFNDFGLVAITRKRVKQSLERTLCSPCPYCEGAGYVKSVQTVISEILVEAQKLSRAIEGKDVMLRVHPEVAKVLKASDNRYLEELEEILGRPVLVMGDPTLHHQKFDLG